MTVSTQDIKKLSRLARIKINDEQIEPTIKKIEPIIDWFEQLGEVDTKDVEILTNVHQENLRLQKDEISDGDKQDEVLKNSNHAKYGYFSVPKVLS